MAPATPENIRLAAALVRAGELVIVPTETVYGLAARSDSPEALARLYAAKGREAAKRVTLFAEGLTGVRDAGIRVDAVAERLAAAFWPGPLTMVLENAQGGWDGFRVPDHPVALAWLREMDFLPAVTSANRSGAPPAVTAGEAWNALAPTVGLALDAGPAAGGKASTVVKVERGELILLRAGPVSSGELAKAAGVSVRHQAPGHPGGMKH